MAEFLRADGSLAQTIYTDDNPILRKMEEELDGTGWQVDEVKMEDDVKQWNTDPRVTVPIKKVCENSIVEFNLFDVMVRVELNGGFPEEIKNIQLASIYTHVAQFEVIHARTYWKMGVSLLGRDRMTVLVQKETCPQYILNKAKWYAAQMTSKYSTEGDEEHIADHARRVAVNCAAEGLFFQPKFASIEWIKKLGLLRGFCYANELIRRDEGLHCRLAGIYYKLLGSPLKKSLVIRIFKEAAELEIAGVMETHPDGLPGLSKTGLCEYIQYSCNFILGLVVTTSRLPYTIPVNPFDWMDVAAAPAQTNFFEKDVSQYQTRGKNHKINRGPDGVIVIPAEF